MCFFRFFFHDYDSCVFLFFENFSGLWTKKLPAQQPNPSHAQKQTSKEPSVDFSKISSTQRKGVCGASELKALVDQPRTIPSVSSSSLHWFTMKPVSAHEVSNAPEKLPPDAK